MKKFDEYKGIIIDIIIALLFIIMFIFLSRYADTVYAAEVVSSDYSSSNTISSNYVSGNSITFEQGESIIHYLKLILFVLTLSFCFSRVRNGIRSLNKLR